MIDPSTLATTIQSQISNTVDEHIRQYVAQIIRELSLDSTWISKIEQQINDGIARKFGQKLSLVDINSLVAEAMDSAVARYFERQRPTSGVKDLAQQTELTVVDGSVAVEHALSTATLRVTEDATVSGTLSVQNISIRGSINTDNRSWQELMDNLAALTLDQLDQEWRDRLVEQVRETISDQGIDFDRVTVAGAPLIENGCLNDRITASNLRQIGTLETLAVSGQADLGDSLAVRPRRVGINTQHPDMALSVWDEEVALVFGKHKQQTAYLGTLKPQAMVVGVNRLPAIEITEQGRVTINHLTVGRHRVCHEPEIPNYSGTKGDIVFNSNPRGDGIWGWQCLGAFKWTPLRSA